LKKKHENRHVNLKPSAVSLLPREGWTTHTSVAKYIIVSCNLRFVQDYFVEFFVACEITINAKSLMGKCNEFHPALLG